MELAGPIRLAGKRVVVMGLGRFGGGAGVARFCARLGANVLVTDQDPPEKLASGLSLIADLKLDLRLGEHRTDDFTGADYVIVNPAVKPDNPFVAAARQAGVALTSEIRLLAAHLPNHAHTIAITGSAGKSTTTAMIGAALAAALGEEHVHVGGNLGGSLLGQIDRIRPEHWVVLELSSFMLQGLREDKWSPHIALITNLSANHLDWHGSFEHYRDAKQALLDFQLPDDIAILTPDAQKHFFPVVNDVRVCPPPVAWKWPLLVPGDHNKTNALLASMAVEAAIGQDREATAQTLADFPGLPHRLQFICEHSDVRFYNDSKATTPEAAMLAIDSFGPHQVHVILGGYDKKTDLTPMAHHAASRCVALYTIGSTGSAIAQAARNSGAHAKIHDCNTLENAVKTAIANVRRGDVVLLSPGCASWDQFENYEQRGSAFARHVITHTGEGSPNPPMKN